MIENEKQYEITKRQIKRFEEALEKLPKTAVTTEYQYYATIARKALESQLEVLSGELAEYEAERH